MTIGEVRRELEAIQASAKAGDLDQVVQHVDSALHALDGSRLLTTTEAAELLGIRSVNTLKLLVLRLGVPYARHGNRMMLPLSEIERLHESAEVRGIRASDRAHDAVAVLGGDGLSQDELDALSQSRPGTVPWQQQRQQRQQQATRAER